jgi:hypothetical protein
MIGAIGLVVFIKLQQFPVAVMTGLDMDPIPYAEQDLINGCQFLAE